MAIWTDNKKIIFILNSGLQYTKIIKLNSVSINLKELIKKAYSDKHMINETDSCVEFDGGHKFVSYFSWILPVTERFLYHNIKVDLPTDNNLELKFTYNAQCYLNIVIASISFQREIKELEALLNSKKTVLLKDTKV